MRRATILGRAALVWAILALVGPLTLRVPLLAGDEPPRQLDPAAWGTDHVEKPVPDYVTGDQCLFCHRMKIGATWSTNRHNLTLREWDPQSAAAAALRESPWADRLGEIQFVMGDRRRQRFLRSAQAYGKLELLSAEWSPTLDQEPGRLLAGESVHWDVNRFADACAGCHATAVNPQEKSFSSLSLDCYVCHGNVPAEHPNQPDLALFSPARKEAARVVTSICAQCHVRTGKSKSTGRPYATNFVAGDNLFRDFAVDFSDEALAGLSTADRHVVENVRDVVVSGDERLTCLTCHDVHDGTTDRHTRLAGSEFCGHCHETLGQAWGLKPVSNHSPTCGFDDAPGQGQGHGRGIESDRGGHDSPGRRMRE